MGLSGRPLAGEYGEYFGKYVGLIETDDIVSALSSQSGETLAFLQGIPDEAAGLPYASGKWTFKEVLGHMTDTERVFTYRALRFARNDAAELPGFDQNAFMAASGFNARRWQSLIEEHGAVRRASVLLFDSLDEGAWLRSGIASSCRMSVRALAFCVAGHERHHLRIVRK